MLDNRSVESTEEVEYIFCYCGCGQKRTKYDKNGIIRLFILGHHNKLHLSSGKGEANGHWKGGKVTRMGYWYIFKPEHPFSSKDNYVAEHRLIMEEYLGRYLNDDEIVHHIDGNKLNNNIKNLQLMTDKEHREHHIKERERNIDGTFLGRNANLLPRIKNSSL